MVYTAYTFKMYLVIENDIYNCTADIGWITGHSYISCTVSLNGATTVIFGRCYLSLNLIDFGQ